MSFEESPVFDPIAPKKVRAGAGLS